MQIVLIGTKEQEDELKSNGIAAGTDIIWVQDITAIQQYSNADAILDLTFIPSQERIAVLKTWLPKLVFINSVIATLADTDALFIRLNAWPTFLISGLIEGSCLQEELKARANTVFQNLHKRIEWLLDETGFVTPRVISMIINEAYFALEEGVSTKEEIDLAMKLGTAYPYGPFEWSQKIGLQNIVALLTELAKREQRYRPCRLLVQEANASY